MKTLFVLSALFSSFTMAHAAPNQEPAQVTCDLIDYETNPGKVIYRETLQPKAGEFQQLVDYKGLSYRLFLSPSIADGDRYSFVMGAKNENGDVVGSAGTLFKGEVPELFLQNGAHIVFSCTKPL